MSRKLKGKNFAILTILVLTVLGFITGSQTWVTYQLAPGEAAFSLLLVSGTTALAPLMPILVALGAVGVTLMIVTRVVRVLLGVLTALLGAWITVNSFKLITGSKASLLKFGGQELAEATGVVVSDDSEMIISVTSSYWPVLTGIVGVLIIIVGLYVTLTGYRWVTSGRKYETKAKQTRNKKSHQNDRIDDWDALSEGEDPSETR